MSLACLLYVSESLVEQGDLAREAEAIVARSLVYNGQVGITGALIAAARHFAQYIEGRVESIDTLLAMLQADRRHTNLHILLREGCAARRFPDWSMAYAGNAYFVSAHVNRLVQLAPHATAAATRGLLDLMNDFTDPAHHPHRS